MLNVDGVDNSAAGASSYAFDCYCDYCAGNGSDYCGPKNRSSGDFDCSGGYVAASEIVHGNYFGSNDTLDCNPLCGGAGAHLD